MCEAKHWRFVRSMAITIDTAASLARNWRARSTIDVNVPCVSLWFRLVATKPQNSLQTTVRVWAALESLLLNIQTPKNTFFRVGRIELPTTNDRIRDTLIIQEFLRSTEKTRKEKSFKRINKEKKNKKLTTRALFNVLCAFVARCGALAVEMGREDRCVMSMSEWEKRGFGTRLHNSGITLNWISFRVSIAKHKNLCFEGTELNLGHFQIVWSTIDVVYAFLINLMVCMWF